MAERDRDDEPRGRAAAIADRRENAPAEQPETPPPPKPGEVVRTDGGMDTRDVVGGGIKETVNIPVTAAPRDRTRQQKLLIQAANAKGTRKLAGIVGRPLEEWGLVGAGDRVIGHFVLVDLETLDKIEVTDEWRIPDDDKRVFANAQQLPKLLVQGEGLKQL